MSAELRRLISNVVRVATADHAAVSGIDPKPYRSGGDHFVEAGVNVVLAIDDMSYTPPELPPLKQLALSVLVGEPIPPVVLLGALEDAGIYPDGVLAAAKAAEDAPLDMGKPVYVPGEPTLVGYERYWRVARGWYRGKMAESSGVCKGVFGRGVPAIGNMVGRFLQRWLGRKEEPLWTPGSSRWPTSEYLAERMRLLPPLVSVYRHLRTTANPTTAAQLTRLIEHLERR